MGSNIPKIVFLILVVAAMAGVSSGQRTAATFAGIVTDPTGAVLPGAEVVMTNEGTAAVTQQVTSETGEFVFNFVSAGTYTIKIALPGFKTYESRGVPLGAAQNVRRTYTLEVGNVTDNVTVTGEAPLVNTLSTEQRMSLETTEIRNLPMVNRNITNVLETATTGLTRGDPIFGGQGMTRFRLNGLGASSFGVMTDGTDSSANPGSPSLGEYGGSGKIDQMSTESFAEVQIIKGVMPAEYGSAMAGTVSLITKSGTNERHGSLFYRYEGSALSARQATLTSEPNSVWNQFGGSLGGPVKQNRAFFFFAYEGYRQRASAALVPIVPTPYFRDIMLTSLPFVQTKLFLDFYPLPNQPYGPTDLLARWVGPGEKQNDDDHIDGKIDYLVGGGNFSVSYAGGHPYQLAALGAPLNPQVFTTSNRRVSANYVFGRGRWTSSTRAGYNKHFYVRQDKLWSQRDPTVVETLPGYGRIPVILFTGMTTLGTTERNSRGPIPSYSLEQQIALVRGTHSLKFGGILSLPSGGKDEIKLQLLNYQTLADIQRNEPSSVPFNAALNPNRWRLINFGFFAQDDWRANRKLVLNLGVRYDRYGHLVVTPTQEGRPALLANLDGLRNAQTFEWGPLRPANNPFESDNLSIGPRFGFAYTMDNTGDFVLRGGFGVNFQRIDPQNVEAGIAKSPNMPADFSFTRADAAARGLKYPLNKEYLEKLVASESAGKASVGIRMQPDQHPSYAMNYTLGIQRALTPTLVLETAYVGTRGVKFYLSRTYNQPDRLTGLKPNPNDVSSSYRDDSQQTSYNSWQTSIKKRLSHGLLFNVQHSWGKGLSYTGANIGWGDTIGGIEDFNNVKVERGLSTGDVAHSVILNWVYEVPTPFANVAVARQVLGGWQISGIWRGQTGAPITISQSGGRPDMVDGKRAVNENCCSYGNLQYLNPAAFQLLPVVAASGRTVRRGHTGPTPLRGPAFTNLNLSLGKTFSVAERTNLELKADMLNALNQTQYTTILTNMSGANFGRAAETSSARVIQLQLRLTF
jgi:hypothetical protein